MNPKELQGAWKAVRIEQQGSFVSGEAAQTLKYIFKDNQVAAMVESHKKTRAGIICLGGTQTPKTLDITLTEGPQSGEKVLGIYEVEVDCLTLCVSDERPTSFSGAGKAVLELRRERPSQP